MKLTNLRIGNYVDGNYVKADTPIDNGDNPSTVADKLDSMVDAMILAAPTLDRQAAAHYLIHTAHGRRLYEHLSKIKESKPMPQVDIMKVIAITEQGLMAQVTKRDNESYAQSFSRKYENDIDFRKQWASLTDAKHSVILKGTATLTPTSTEVGSSLVADDSAEAVRLLREMATKQGRTFEQVFADPANVKLAGRTYHG